MLRLRRRSDKAWFVAGLLMTAFSLSVLVYKLKIEPPEDLPRNAEPASAQTGVETPALPPEEPPAESASPDPVPEEIPEAVNPSSAAAETPVERSQASTPAPVQVRPHSSGKAPASKARKPGRPAPPPYEPITPSRPWQGVFDKEGRMSVRFQQVDGQNAMQVTYDFQDGQRVQAVQNVDADFSAYTRLQFFFRGEGDDGNNVEVRIEDADGTLVGAFLLGKANVSDWTPVNIPLSSLRMVKPGADGRMEWARVRRLSLAVSGHPWTKGSLWYKGLKIR